MGPSCTLTSTRTRPTPTPCPPVWAHRLTTLSREIKTRYTGRCEAAVRGQTGCLARRRVLSRLAWDSHECCRCRGSGVQEKRRIVVVEPGTAEQSWRCNAGEKTLILALIRTVSIISIRLFSRRFSWSNNYKIKVKNNSHLRYFLSISVSVV